MGIYYLFGKGRKRDKNPKITLGSYGRKNRNPGEELDNEDRADSPLKYGVHNADKERWGEKGFPHIFESPSR